MLAVQALLNAIVFGFGACLFIGGGDLSTTFLTLACLSAMFIVSAFCATKPFGRLILIGTWIAAIATITPKLPGGLMEGGVIGVPMFLYLVAGLVGAIFLPVKDSPDPSAPT